MAKKTKGGKKPVYIARHSQVKAVTLAMEEARAKTKEYIPKVKASKKVLSLFGDSAEVKSEVMTVDSIAAFSDFDILGDISDVVVSAPTDSTDSAITSEIIVEIPFVSTSPRDEFILGIHYGHDSTAALMKNGVLVEAMQEERLSRAKKHYGFPHESLAYIYRKYNIGISDITKVIVVGKDAADGAGMFVTKEENLAGRKLGIVSGKHFLRAIGVKFPIVGKLYEIRDKWVNRGSKKGVAREVEDFLRSTFEWDGVSRVVRIEHHDAHAWSSVLFMNDKSKPHLVFTLDGVGDGISGTVSIFEHGSMHKKSEVALDASIGMLYSGVTDLLGMARNEHEFKVMGLAPYAKASSGEKVYDKLRELIWFDESAMTFKSSIPQSKAIAYATHYLMANDFIKHRFDSLAYGVQKLTEELVTSLINAATARYGVSSVALGGGVFMNVKANQKILSLSSIKDLVITPSAGDESLALGACAYGYSLIHSGDISGLTQVNDLYLGSEYNSEQVKSVIEDYLSELKDCEIQYFDGTDGLEIERKIAELLASNHVVGRLKGRAEWGARALGNRSILANAKSRDTVKHINEMIKGRDFWMPFATSIKEEAVKEYLVNEKEFYAPFMSVTFDTQSLSQHKLAAAIHPYDLTSRPQMVRESVNASYYGLLSFMETATGVPAVLNTSFNLHGEPNVETPEDAMKTFLHSGLRYLAIENYLISKK